MTEDAPLHVLVIEDDDDLRDAIMDSLVQRYTLVGVRSAAEALRLLGLVAAQVVVLDLTMPSMSGEDFAAECARRGYRVPMVAVSADHARLARAEFAFARIAKPFEIDALVAQIELAARFQPP